MSLRLRPSFCSSVNAAAPTEIYTLSLHDALPISRKSRTTSLLTLGAIRSSTILSPPTPILAGSPYTTSSRGRSEEHTSELQSLRHLVCRLLLEKKNKTSMTKMRCYTTSHRYCAI